MKKRRQGAGGGRLEEAGDSEGKPDGEPLRGGPFTKEAVAETVEAWLERGKVEGGCVLVEKPLD